MTIAEVAARAGVSPMTVSRTLAGSAPVRTATVARVRRAVAQLDYRPNVAARLLAGGTPRRLALVYANPSQAYLSELLVGTLEEAARHGLQVVLERLGPAGRGRATAWVARALRGAGAVLLPPSIGDVPGVAAALARAGACWAALSPADPSVHPLSVSVDDEAAARRMTQHLLDLGHRRIGFIAGDPAYRAAHDRERGFRAALAAAGLEPGPVERGGFSFESGREAAVRMLGRDPACTALFASNDDMAAGALAAAQRRGLEVPARLSIVGFDDSPVASTVYPGITTMRQPIAEMAAAAVGRLAGALRARAEGRAVEPAHDRFDCRLVARESAAPCGGARAARMHAPERLRPRARRP